MSATIIRERERVNEVHYDLYFEWSDRPGAGFGFPCTQDGTVLLDGMTELARENLNKCLSDELNVIPMGVRTLHNSYIQTAILKCSHCDTQFNAYPDSTGACDCPKCDTCYNAYTGQEYRPRNQWEEPIDED